MLLLIVMLFLSLIIEFVAFVMLFFISGVLGEINVFIFFQTLVMSPPPSIWVPFVSLRPPSSFHPYKPVSSRSFCYLIKGRCYGLKSTYMTIIKTPLNVCATATTGLEVCLTDVRNTFSVVTYQNYLRFTIIFII